MGRDTRIELLDRLRTGLLAALILAGGCGSGSSGFDGTANSEVDAILQATTDLTCVRFRETTYCGSGAAFPLNGDTGVVAFEDPVDPLPCPQLPGEPGCTTSVGFIPDGFGAGAAYLAAWSESVEGPWILSNTVDAATPMTDPDNRTVEIDLPDTGAGAPPSPLLVAVLVFAEGAPAGLPAAVDQLLEFGADVVYVTSELEVAAAPGQ